MGKIEIQHPKLKNAKPRVVSERAARHWYKRGWKPVRKQKAPTPAAEPTTTNSDGEE